ncbi:MAG: TIM-barrel domain-containing protein [Sphingomicrobium sp.]
MANLFRAQLLCASLLAACFPAPATAQALGAIEDSSAEFQKVENTYFVADNLTSFNPANGAGLIEWKRYRRKTTYSFLKVDQALAPDTQNEEFPTEYDAAPRTPFQLDFVSPRTVRVRFSTSTDPIRNAPSLMLAGPVPKDGSWKAEQTDKGVTYRSAYGSVTIVKAPFAIEFRDAAGKLLTSTQNKAEHGSFAGPLGLTFVRRMSDLGREVALPLRMSHDEGIYGFGESFTRLNKRGQKVDLFMRDAMGVQTPMMYKPVPMFLSSQGYGVFLHSSAPITMDVGRTYDQSNVAYINDPNLDMFVFLGEPKDVLTEYTGITGRSPVPPLWSFGFWMSRITYNSEDQVRGVAAKLRQYKLPTDVIHLDTGWFEYDWRNDYKFSTSRFRDPAKMMTDLKKDGFRISLWQLPYFGRKNALYNEIVAKGLAVKNAAGEVPDEDATLDFSNPATVVWYQDKLRDLLKMGASVIKVDFGEGAPINGVYASGNTGRLEHNLYPVRYNKAAWDVTKQTTGDGIIWARAAWAGSQRYPLHWGGDAENTNSAMAAELRGGLSFGLSGFTYWSHDVGGFVNKAPRDLYRRWMAMGVLTSHTRAHGAPPREPWEYDSALTDDFRRALNLKYSLMPYIYGQAVESSAKGHPMLRSLFFEYPNDPGAWAVDDEYMFGSKLLVAPLFEDGATGRRIYLPAGDWIDYQTGKAYRGGGWHQVQAGQIPVVLMVRNNSVIPHVAVAQSTDRIDWKNVELRVFSTNGATATGEIALPDGPVRTLTVENGVLRDDPYAGKVRWTIVPASVTQ